MAYGGNDALADMADLQLTLEELQSKPELLYIENYGHVDFLVGLKAKEDVYDHMIRFFMSFGKSSSSWTDWPLQVVSTQSYSSSEMCEKSKVVYPSSSL